MRWIDRGPEPSTVAGYAQQFTPGWVEYFENQIGGRPTDSYWQDYRADLGAQSNNICWYCEQQCYAAADAGGRAPTVDHFRPLSESPRLAYAWSNWVFSCRRCNSENKQDRWPETGYIDPCAATVAERPEQYFDYDADTGSIIPRNDISDLAQRKAQHTIDDLGLNKLDLRFYRLDWTRRFREDLLSLPPSEQQALIATFTEQPVEYAGATGMMVAQLRRDGRVPQ